MNQIHASLFEPNQQFIDHLRVATFIGKVTIDHLKGHEAVLTSFLDQRIKLQIQTMHGKLLWVDGKNTRPFAICVQLNNFNLFQQNLNATNNQLKTFSSCQTFGNSLANSPQFYPSDVWLPLPRNCGLT